MFSVVESRAAKNDQSLASRYTSCPPVAPLRLVPYVSVSAVAVGSYLKST